MDVDDETPDASERVGDHFLLDGDARTRQIPLMAFGGDSHDGEHTGAERSSEHIRRREAFALAVVVDGSVGEHDGATRTMHGLAAQFAFIGNRHFDHGKPLYMIER